MGSSKVDPLVSIIWVDSDPGIRNSANLLEAQNWRVAYFNETADALSALREDVLKPAQINCVITSMMERGGRRERGLLNGLQMLDEMKIIWKDAGLSYSPLIAIISVTADEQECREHGAEIIVIGKRNEMLKQVINRLNKNSDPSHREKWREPSLLPCLELREIAIAYLKKLNLDKRNFDSFGDHCFCQTCEPKRIWERCGEKYSLPTGYYRFGLLLRHEFAERRVDVQHWPVAYHGTPTRNLDSILRHRRIMFPGDHLDDGTILPVRLGQCHAYKSPVIYVSPSILYSQHEIYSPAVHFKLDSSLPSKGYTIKTVLQCRVKPNSYRKCHETLGYDDQRVDNDFNNSELEWVVEDKTAVVPYGLLIGIFPE